ncbi:MAG TPA: hypothetical protein VNA69_13200 [Thermoanaerobaculia bacterium]|nr:hypothetical protein [Thermoanaerobaculia bacterium]
MVDLINLVRNWLDLEEEAGEEFGPVLIGLPTGTWRSEMDRDSDLRRYGTLRYVLRVIREDLFQHPARARERAAVIVDYAARVEVFVEQHRVGLAGLAWKEYANALRCTGEFDKAIDAARRSCDILSAFGSFACDAAKAKLTEALVHRERGNLEAVLFIARMCAKVFRDYSDSEAYVQARMTEALALSDAKRHKEAMRIFAETAVDAEERDDRHALAICLHNAADCARALGDRTAARELDARALSHSEYLGAIERPHIRWTYAMTLAEDNRVNAAISELYLARGECLALGMNALAACYGLDIVRLKFDRGDDVTASCSELVDEFARRGMMQSAIEALAYLREEAIRHTITPQKIQYIREFVSETAKAPLRLFAPPVDDEGGA